MTTQLATNRAKLVDFERQAVDAFERGDDDLTLARIEEGAIWSWGHHPGRFASSTFEQLLRAVGTRHAVTRTNTGTSSTTLRVLHVLTEAYATGGHTRLTWRWLEHDRTREHTVVITEQIHDPVPDALARAAHGRVFHLDGESRVDRLRNLADMMMGFDLVVLNIHPHDAVVAAACAASTDRPRTFLVNHADHVFWIGASAADQIVELRPSAISITQERRVSSPSVSVLLPLPLDEPSADPVRGQSLRTSLGIPDNAPVSLCLADAYKFTDTSGGRFVGLLRHALTRHTELHHIAIGPNSETPQWRELAHDFPERLHVLGRTPAYHASFDAATFFLDSYPFSSITAALEAACWGLPVLTLGDRGVTPLGFDDAGLVPRRAGSDDEWIATIREWSTHPEIARREGETMRLDTLSFHRPAKWMSRWEALLRTPWQRPRDFTIPEETSFQPMDAGIELLGRTRLEMFR